MTDQPLSREEFFKKESEKCNKYSPILWARNIFKNPDKYLVLDTETTGLGDSELVEISVINLRSEILLNTLVNPLSPIYDEVIRIHGITNEMVIDAPTFEDLYLDLLELLEDKVTIIYNAAFDVQILNYSCYLDNVDAIPIDAECLMLQYAQFYGEWSNYFGGYKWQKLPNGNHRALGDCEAALRLLHTMAGTYLDLIDNFESAYRGYLITWEREQWERQKREASDPLWDIPF